ncbi:DarT ssDNA thymidine ADP-ribosyltransferase family protein [Niallia taxi]|uniref:DarT ssDNA thymidine ADP-ribosyltransferase family protein n=1 Tax=Niallia taxi TaxID=2499688 RepID=UPI002E22ADDC|nr:DarT ssDNA thymidine ADP-ribosyltransferase family protein [Niallia taxi]
MIREFILQQEITRLCHFTRINKLLHIMTDSSGIVANNFIVSSGQNELLNKNDNYRYDGKEDYISCSIQYPNSWYLNRVINTDPLFKNWAILLIDPFIMEEEDTLFCFTNAAYNRGAHLKKGYNGLKELFHPSVTGKRTWRRSQYMLNNCPTDGQAEVMIHRNIPQSRIKGIIFRTYKQAEDALIMLNMLNVSVNIPIYIAPDLFLNNWSNLIRMGQVPKEILYREE